MPARVVDVASVDAAVASIRAAAARGRKDEEEMKELRVALIQAKDEYQRLELQIEASRAKTEAVEGLLADLKGQLAQEQVRAAQAKKELEANYEKELEAGRERLRLAAETDRKALEKGLLDLQTEMAEKLRLGAEQTATNQALLRSLVEAQEKSRAEAEAAVKRAEEEVKAMKEQAKRGSVSPLHVGSTLITTAEANNRPKAPA